MDLHTKYNPPKLFCDRYNFSPLFSSNHYRKPKIELNSMQFLTGSGLPNFFYIMPIVQPRLTPIGNGVKIWIISCIILWNTKVTFCKIDLNVGEKYCKSGAGIDKFKDSLKITVGNRVINYD